MTPTQADQLNTLLERIAKALDVIAAHVAMMAGPDGTSDMLVEVSKSIDHLADVTEGA